MTSRPPSSSPAPVDLAIARFIKAAGALIAIYAAMTTRDEASFAVAALMMTGGQGAENVIRRR